jgi:predicted component of type VI protein secretion system
MLPKIKNNLTNWVDGMKINRQHFIDSENAILDYMRDASAMNLKSYNYGLLEPIQGEKSSLDCNVLYSQPNQFKISVSYCRAITPGGCRIEILPGIHPELTSDNDIFNEVEKTNNARYLAVISVNPFDRNPYGNADANEYPVRNQYSISSYRLSLVNEETLNSGSLGGGNLAIARFTLVNGELVRDNNYIPPCAVITAHPGSRQISQGIADSFNVIQEYSREIQQKIVELNQTRPLAVNVRRLCEESIMYISSEFFAFRTVYRQESPLHIANSVVTLAGILSTCISFISVKEKEEMLEYFHHWNGINPGAFEEIISKVKNADYNHENLHQFFEPLMDFLKVWIDLLEKLKALKLIGNMKDNFDFGGRTIETSKETNKGKFSIFD